jgi:hypothetical protein
MTTTNRPDDWPDTPLISCKEAFEVAFRYLDACYREWPEMPLDLICSDMNLETGSDGRPLDWAAQQRWIDAFKTHTSGR